MKKYYYKNGQNLLKNISIFKIIISFSLLSIFLFFVFYILIGSYTEFVRAIITSIIISILVNTSFTTTYLLNIKERIYVIYNKKLYIIMFQNDSYIEDENYLSTDELLKDDKLIKEVIENNKKYIGVNVIDVDKATVIEKNNKSVIKITGKKSYWVPKGSLFTIDNYILRYKNINKRYIINNNYSNYKELVESINSLYK